MSQAREPTELTPALLGWLVRVGGPSAGPLDVDRAFDLGLAERTESGGCRLTPRGRELVDIAVRAVNVELRERGSR